jgi:hypothetical protein
MDEARAGLIEHPTVQICDNFSRPGSSPLCANNSHAILLGRRATRFPGNRLDDRTAFLQRQLVLKNPARELAAAGRIDSVISGYKEFRCLQRGDKHFARCPNPDLSLNSLMQRCLCRLEGRWFS